MKIVFTGSVPRTPLLVKAGRVSLYLLTENRTFHEHGTVLGVSSHTTCVCVKVMHMSYFVVCVEL